MTADLTVMRDRLRKETAALLGLDIDNLTAAQSVRLDRCSTLRLELDDIESRKLQGAAFDAVKYIAVSEALERLVGGHPEQTANNPNYDAALAAVEQSIQGVIDVHHLKAAERDTETMMREEMAAIAAASNCASGDAHEGERPAPAAAPADDAPARVTDAARLPPPAEHPLRSHSMNNPNTEPLPRKPTEVSGTYGAFADYTARRASSFRRFDMPDGF
jgi:hypothetical protein